MYVVIAVLLTMPLCVLNFILASPIVVPYWVCRIVQSAFKGVMKRVYNSKNIWH